MNRLHAATRGIRSWQAGLAHPDRQWKRGFSAFEAAVSWELAARSPCGLPEPLAELLRRQFGELELLFAVAEHQVPLPGGKACSQNDVWALVRTPSGTVSMTVEAKAKEAFGDHELCGWLIAGKSETSLRNRELRWAYLREHLPAMADDAYSAIAYQLLHRCASAVVEARRFGLKHAACIVQAFGTPDELFADFAAFGRAMGVDVERGGATKAFVGEIELTIGWIDCPLATDAQVARVA